MEKWIERWGKNQLRWHKDQVDPFLIKHLTQLKEAETNQGCSASSAKTFFVPLCGKTLDIGYILSQGYNVFGVEGVSQAIDTLNSENEFALQFDEQNSLYSSFDCKLRIYLGDLFTCPVDKWGPFDFVWDKGSLTAIDEKDRKLYKLAMQASVRIPSTVQYHNFKYLLRTVIYDKSKWDGKGPKCVSESDMEDMYGDWTDIKLLESTPLPDNHILRKNSNIGSTCHENLYLLTRKQ